MQCEKTIYLSPIVKIYVILSLSCNVTYKLSCVCEEILKIYLYDRSTFIINTMPETYSCIHIFHHTQILMI